MIMTTTSSGFLTEGCTGTIPKRQATYYIFDTLFLFQALTGNNWTIHRACAALRLALPLSPMEQSIIPERRWNHYSATQRALSIAASDTLSVYQLDLMVIYGEQILSNSW